MFFKNLEGINQEKTKMVKKLLKYLMKLLLALLIFLLKM